MTPSVDFTAILARLPPGLRFREALDQTYEGVRRAELVRAGKRGRLAWVAPLAAISGTVAVATYDAAISLVAGVVSAVAGLWTGWSLWNGARQARRGLHSVPRLATLEAVRAQRPHAGDADPTVVHVEYAVDVDAEGDLVLWQFLPVPYGVTEQELPADWLLLGGRPNYIASKLRRLDADRHSTSDSAAAVVDWQEHAAETERRAAAVARRDADAVVPSDRLDFVSADLLRRLIPGRGES